MLKLDYWWTIERSEIFDNLSFFQQFRFGFWEQKISVFEIWVLKASFQFFVIFSPVGASIRPSFYMSIILYVHSFIYSSFHVSTHSYIHPSNFSFLHMSIKTKNLPLGITEGSVLKRRRRQSAADCLTTSSVSLNNTNIHSKYTLSLFPIPLSPLTIYILEALKYLNKKTNVFAVWIVTLNINSHLFHSQYLIGPVNQ